MHSPALRPSIAPRPLTGLAARLGLTYTDPGTVTGVTHDSRTVRRGDLYVALPGSHVHGAEYAPAALAAGASVILTDPEGESRMGPVPVPVFVVENPRSVLGDVSAWVYGRPSTKLVTIGVTGTNGKTTTTYLLERGLAAAGHHTGMIGTVQTRIGSEVFPSTRTTPEATDLQAMFALMVQRDVTAAAVEVSSHALAFGRADATTYDVAVFTNLTQDHLDFHGDLDSYFAAKALLFTPAHSRVGAINIDDPYGRMLVDRSRVPVTTFSAAGVAEADWRAIDVRQGSDGSVFRVVGPGGVQADASVQLPGPFNVTNALGAVVALVEAGVGLPAAVMGVSSLPGVPGRMERVDAGQEFTAVVDYAHTPDAVSTVLAALRAVTTGRVIVVLGCGGDRDKAKRPSMGAAAATLADVAILTDDNPRSEDPLSILTAMQSGIVEVAAEERAHVVVEPDRAAAIALAVDRARGGDVVVVAGKGHEQGQEVRGVVHPFDDRTVLRDALESITKPSFTEQAWEGSA